jgi:glycosyltransferase domain-containing protein
MSGVTTQQPSVKKTTALNTLVVLTQNRPDFLRRALQYSLGYEGPVLVLDSSELANTEVQTQFPGVGYQHVPQFAQTAAQDKLAYAVEHVTTPYTTFCHDDDFLIHDGLADCVTFLQDHDDYGVCHGYSLNYRLAGSQMEYWRRDKKVREDFNDERPQDRVLSTMAHFKPLSRGVIRTELLRQWFAVLSQPLSASWLEIGLSWYLAASAKVRVLPIAYAVCEITRAPARLKPQLISALGNIDLASRTERERFAGFLVTLAKAQLGDDVRAAHSFVLQSFATLNDALRVAGSTPHERLIESNWTNPLNEPVRCFAKTQYVELPFYNQTVFSRLDEIEFLIGAIPAGVEQLNALEGAWVQQEQLLRQHDNDTAETIAGRLWAALDINAFNREVVSQMAVQLKALNEPEEARGMTQWLQRLDAVSALDHQQLLQATPSGQLLSWLEARRPGHEVVELTSAYLTEQGGGPQFGILLLDLDDDMDKLQMTLDSLVEGAFKSFKVVVFTTGELPVATSIQNTLHFVKVSKSNYVDKLNQIARQISSGWLLLANAGDQFTAGGLLRAALEIHQAPDCRAVAGDEIQRQPDGALRDVFRPGFNLDLLLRLPGQMAHHWLMRKDVLVEAGGFNADFAHALEFELILRIIQQGGLAWLAHLDEPLLTCDSPSTQENNDERTALIRHLTGLGYKPQVNTGLPGTYQIDYRHVERPMVSIIVRHQGDLPALQRCLASVLQRTRYAQYQLLVVDNHGESNDARTWLDTQARQNRRIRVLSAEQHLSDAALCNLAAQSAEGEYLVLLSGEAEVVNPNWIEALLNQAMRPEVGVVGAKLIDRVTGITGAGLILGMNDGVGSAFVGESKDAVGYMHRLALEQNYSAVSGACLMVRKALFDEAGGLDQGPFAEAFSDVDLCLKLGQAGFLTVWTPQVQVIHPGTVPDAAEALAALQEKWASGFAHDLAYNQNLAMTGKGFTLGAASGVNWSQLLA